MMSDEYYKEIVESIKQSTVYYDKCLEEQDTLRKCILCKKYLNDKQWPLVLERHIKEKFNIEKPTDEVSGDGKSRNNYNIEIKVSLGGTNGQFNFVQLRPDHKIHFYILLAYNINEGEIGTLYWFLCEPKDLYSLLPKYGGYAHGTIKQNGSIDTTNLYGNNKEFALRPNPAKPNTNKSRQLWNIMIDKFRTTAEEIQAIL